MSTPDHIPPGELNSPQVPRQRRRQRARSARARQPKAHEQSRNLLDVVERGAVIRRHRFLVDFRLLLVPSALSGMLQCIIYTAFIVNAGRSDWHNLFIVCVVLMTMPFMVSAFLASLRSRDFPFTVSALLTLVVYNFGVVVLSALRIPISYTALFWTAPVAIAAMILAATRLTKIGHEKLAILDFPGVKKVAQMIGGDITVVTEKTFNLTDFDRILIDGETHYTPAWNSHITRAHMRGARISPWFAVYEQKWGRVILEHFDITHLAYTPSQIYYAKIKRIFDILLVLLALPIVVPIGAIVWLYIRLIDGGPSLFVQTRRGYAGKNFRMLKFRTMYVGTHGGATGDRDSRILPGCRLLRRFRLDELPQLINILRGEMSWIGPRPVSLEIASQCEKLNPSYTARYFVLPGITGWAQVRYGYAATASEELDKLAYDLYYLKRISLDLDLAIVMRTLRTLVTQGGAR